MRVLEHRIEAVDWRRRCSEILASGAEMLDFLTAVDEPERNQIEIVVHLVDVPAKVRHLLLTYVDRADPSLASIADLYAGARWHERETHEMFGVQFLGNSDMRPLLTSGGSTWPLRRTFDLPARAQGRASDPTSQVTGRTG